ncbi:septal ring lytic transglycosylase RlpA family protein, partial [Methylopila musalis]
VVAEADASKLALAAPAPRAAPQRLAKAPGRRTPGVVASPRTVGVGLASWYGGKFHGRRTANGEIYDKTALTAAHPSLPLPSYVRVTNVSNGRSVVVRVNDRGPFHKGRLIDVSARTADMLGFRSSGVGAVKVDYVGPADPQGSDERKLLASYRDPAAPLGGGVQMASLDPAPAASNAVAPVAAPMPRVATVIPPQPA